MIIQRFKIYRTVEHLFRVRYDCLFRHTLLILIFAFSYPCMAQAQPIPLLDCPAGQQLCDFSPIIVPNGVWGPGNIQESGTCMFTGETSSHWYIFTCTQSGTFNFSCAPTAIVDYDFALFNITGSAPGTCNISAATQILCNYAATTGLTGIGCGLPGCNPTQNITAGNTYALLINRYTTGSIVGYTLSFSGTAQIGLNASTLSAQTVCLGNPTTFTLTNTPTSNVVFNWNFGDGTYSALANPTHTYNTPGAYNVSLQITSIMGNACLNQTLTTTAIVSNGPGISVLPAIQTICPGQTATLSALTSPPITATYSWSPAITLSSSTGATVTATPTQNTTYTVQAIDASGCSNSATTVVNIGSNLSITASATNTTICAGTSTILNVSGASTYTWTPSADLSASTGAVVTATPNASTTYTVTGTNAVGCTASATVAISILPQPMISVNPAAPIICSGQNVNISASGASTYTWSPNIAITATTGANVTSNPLTTTTYTLTGTSASGCTTQHTVVVTVVNTPTISVTPNNPFVCSGAAATMTASGANTFTWSPSAGLNATTGATVSASPSGTTTYTVIGTLNSGCTGSTTVVVSLGNNPTVTTNPSTSQLCDGANINISAFGAISYLWSPSNTLNNPTSPSVIANPTINTTYTVIGTAANGCTASATSAISLVQPQQVIATFDLSVVCPGDTVILTAQNSNLYAWTPTGGAGQNTSIYTVTPMTATTYTVNGIDLNGCTSTTTIAVQVLTSPTVTASNSHSIICQGDSTILTATGAINYSWAPWTDLSSTSGSIVIASPPANTTYTVSGVDGSGCSGNGTVVVEVVPYPISSFIVEPDNGCDPLTVSFTNSSANATTYFWNFGNGQTSTSVNATMIYPVGTYYPSLVASNAVGCSDTTVLGTGIHVYPPPLAEFSSIPDTGVVMKYTEALVAFTNLSQGANTYSWNFGDGTVDNNTNPTHRYLSQGIYMVKLSAISEHGCLAEIMKGPYIVEGMPPVYVPNSFSPNGDGRNDLFRVYAIGLKGLELKIFDRWGTQVFSSNDIGAEWDGTFNGVKLNEGTYVYQLRAILQNGDSLLKYGDITLVR